jgi:hypothetical protein
LGDVTFAMKNTHETLPESLLNDAEQLANFFSLEISERVCDCPQEVDIAAIEEVLIKYRALILQNAH